MKVLVINAGSSSLKYSLFLGHDLQLIYHGLVDHLEIHPGDEEITLEHHEAEKYIDAFAQIENRLQELGCLSTICELSAIAHRVVHGGEIFHEPVIIDNDVIQSIEELTPLAPIHTPANLAPIKFIAGHYPSIEQVAVFDTAFHQTLPDYAYHYALPDQLYQQHQIRKYGFHGSSHEFIVERFADLHDKPVEECNLISLHLGNGASVCAIEMGESIDTSMGFTPLEGLVMGTRSGDLDPAIPLYLIKRLGYSADQVYHLLNEQSGLLGLCGESDMRTILEVIDNPEIENHAAELAIELYVYRLNKIIGSYMAIMDEVDAIVFTGGIGENAAAIRELVINGFSTMLNLEVDESENEAMIAGQEGVISTETSSIPVWVIPTDEEWQIAQHALSLVEE